MNDPKLYLAIDNCFASKRWTRPEQWISIAKDLNVNYVETSADTECDPLYTPGEYLRDWSRDVRRECSRQGVRISSLYSGHGTYKTLGLSHNEERVREHITEKWIKPYLALAKELEAGVGFYCHAFSQEALQDAVLYRREVELLYETLLGISRYNREIGGGELSLEQMYTPHQYPWTIDSTLELMRRAEVYTTLDTGHQTGQSGFLRPSPDQLEKECRPGGNYIWVGSKAAHDLLRESQGGRLAPAEAVAGIIDDMSRIPHLFAQPADCCLYNWLERLGCYCPIIHLQQTNGQHSNHDSFSFSTNPDDKVHPEQVLASLARSYNAERDDGIEKCGKIYFTLELFYPTTAYPTTILSQLRESVAFWRAFIPEDGMLLSEALSHAESGKQKGALPL